MTAPVPIRTRKKVPIASEAAFLTATGSILSWFVCDGRLVQMAACLEKDRELVG